ncbi:hypothetical protein GCM10010170_051190 [Dactylosporangium salmoneum]|uniref:Uncharacterized protein n=1 Tax=Dactylosporangium salmoneum TaxID=53361 RepID=A0ABN3GRL9_9ACTN
MAAATRATATRATATRAAVPSATQQANTSPAVAAAVVPFAAVPVLLSAVRRLRAMPSEPLAGGGIPRRHRGLARRARCD